MGLCQGTVQIHWSQDESPAKPTFLEGLDVADPSFENWLRVMRHEPFPDTGLRFSRQFDEPRWKVLIAPDQTGQNDAHILACTDLLERVLREQGELELTEIPGADTHDRLVQVDVQRQTTVSGKPGLRVTANDLRLNRQIWAETWSASSGVGTDHQDIDMLGMVFRLQTDLTRYMAQSRDLIGTDDCPPLILGAAIPRIFSFRQGDLDLAAEMLSNAMDSRNAAQFLGWQAQIAVINLIEQFTDAPEACVERGKMLAAKAIEMNPMNSVVLSTAANAQVLLDRGDAAAGADLAQLAVRVNPANPFAWWAYANVAIYSGQTDSALQSARVGARLAARTPLQFWCDFQVGLAAIKAGDLKTATKSLETSASLAPQFRPPRRYLLAIYAHQHEYDKAARVLQQLKSLEPEFSLDGFVHDPQYPISLVRKERMLSWSNFGELTDVI